MDKQVLESKCKRCGLCCHQKIRINGKIHIFLNSPCPYLRAVDNKHSCTTYETRLDSSVSCIDLEHAIREGILPETCGYADMFPQDYIYPKLVSSLKDL